MSGANAQTGPVGLVVVSHSRALARAAVSLAGEMVTDQQVPVAVAAGLDEDTTGTDAMAILDAIHEVDGAAGVVVLMDLGSAVLSAELALDLLDDEEVRARVTLTPAPLVEGLVVAMVAAAGGATRAEVAAEAQDALLGKVAQLAGPDGSVRPAAGPALSGPTARDSFTVANPHGLHARPAARLVAVVRGYDAEVALRNLTTGTGPVPAGSLSRVATLAALSGHQVAVEATGPQAHDVVADVLALALRHFDEEPETAIAPPRPAASSGPLAGSPGIAIGPVRHLAYAEPATDLPASSPSDEAARLAAATEEVRQEIARVRQVAARGRSAEAGIFDAHLLLLDDTDVLAKIGRWIEAGESAAAACQAAYAAVEQEWAALPDPYLQARAEDVRAIGGMLQRALTGTPLTRVSGPGILLADELTPAQAAELDPAVVLGILLAYGSPTSHAMILARSAGIPALVGVGADVLDLAEGTTIALDADRDELVVEPADDVLTQLRERMAVASAAADQARAAEHDPAVTLDGTTIRVGVNLGSAAEAAPAADRGADRVGLVRTEFLFLDRVTAPDAHEQAEHYRTIAAAFTGRRVTFRTLDVGGDKPLGYLPMPAEANPFLGVRGLRLTLEQPELLRTQLRAVLEVARDIPLDLMFPMVSTRSELRAARQLLAEVAGPDGVPASLRVGIMVEVPAAALKLASFLPDLDFVSIGTNDLTQYALAAERGNPAVAALSDPLDPGVLRLIDHVCRAAADRVPVSVCGEAAGDPAAVPLLLGLGVTGLSVAPPTVAAVKAQIRGLDLDRCRTLAREALDLADGEAVRALVNERTPT